MLSDPRHAGFCRSPIPLSARLIRACAQTELPALPLQLQAALSSTDALQPVFRARAKFACPVCLHLLTACTDQVKDLHCNRKWENYKGLQPLLADQSHSAAIGLLVLKVLLQVAHSGLPRSCSSLGRDRRWPSFIIDYAAVQSATILTCQQNHPAGSVSLSPAHLAVQLP